MRLKKQSLGLILLFTTIICGSFVLSSSTQAAKKKKKTSKSTVTDNCIACLNSFDPATLKFGIDEEKCTKRVAKCFKSNLTSQCEEIIQECIQAHCSASGSCADEGGNRALFTGCLKAENIVLPYQCASYIAGYASSKAEEANNLKTQQANALKQKELDAKKAASDAEKAKTDADLKAKQIAEEAEKEKERIKGENDIKLAQEKARLEQEAKDAETIRQRKAEQEAKNNKPNVKYANLKNEAKQSLISAKNYITKAYNLLGITTADNKKNNSTPVVNIYNISKIDDSTKAQNLYKTSRYNKSGDFICTKDVKENVIKNEIQNAYNVIKKSYDKLTTGISEIEAANSDDETSGKISDSKINELYDLQNLLSDTMLSIDSRTSSLKTSCETRCEGLTPFSLTASVSAKIEYDANGNIIQDKAKNSNNYSCKELENSTGLNAIIGMESASTIDANKVKDLTRNVITSVLETDKILDENLIKIQLEKFVTNTINLTAIKSCAQYMVLDIASYTNCATNVLGQQFTALTDNKDNKDVKDSLNDSISTIVKTLKSNNYSDYHNENISCVCGGSTDSNNCTTTTTTPISSANIKQLQDYNDFFECIQSITNVLNKVKSDKTTGLSNFQVEDITTNDITLTDGTTLTPKYFATNKLKWRLGENTTCSITVQKEAGTTTTTTNMFGQPTTYTTESNKIDLRKSKITCGTTNTCTANFSQINMGNYSRNCSAN